MDAEVLEGVEREVGRGCAPEQAVVLAAHRAQLARDAAGGDRVAFERAPEQLERRLELLDHHFVGAQPPQVLDGAHVARADDDPRGRRQRAGRGHAAPLLHRGRDGEDDGPGPRARDPLEQRAPRAVAVDGRQPVGARLAHELQVLIDDRAADARRAQHPRQIAAGDAVADDDGVIAETGGEQAVAIRLAALRPPAGARDPRRHGFGHAPGRPDDEGRGQEREHGGRQERLVVVAGEQAQRQAGRGEHERELAHLRQTQAAAQRGVQGPSAEEDRAGRHRRLDRHDRQRPPDDQERLSRQHGQVEQHADGREEDAAEERAEGDDVGERLLAVLRLRDEQPGQERPDGQREPRGGAHQRGADGEEADAEREEIAVPQGRHPVERPAHREAPADHQRRHRAEAGEHPHPERRQALPAAGGGEQRQQRHERHDAQVLEQQDRHRFPPVRRVELAAVGIRPGHHRGRRHRGEGAVEERAVRRDFQSRPERGRGREHARHLPPAGHEDRASLAQHVGERQFQADLEQQQHDADLGQRRHRLRVRDQRGARRADEDAQDEKAGQGGQAQALREGDDRQGQPGDDRQVAEDAEVVHRERARGTCAA